MTWQDRTEGGRKRAILIDVETRDWVISDGLLQWDSTCGSQVYHALLTAIGSIPTSPKYGSRVHEAWPMTVSMPRELESSLRASLEPLVKAGVIKADPIRIEVTPYGGGIGAIQVNYVDGGGQSRDLYVPLQPGIRD